MTTMTIRVNEIFYSLQGEGARAGEASSFIRVSGCDQTCGFCDTEFESGKEMPLSYLASRIGLNPGRWIVFTGGEPMLQLTEEIIQYFKDLGHKIAIESNGNHPVPRSVDWICISPKVAEHVLAKNFPDGVDELRYVRHSGQPGIPKPSIKAKTLFLSPMFRGNEPDKENMAHCTKLCLENPEWRLSLQMHKLWRIL